MSREDLRALMRTMVPPDRPLGTSKIEKITALNKLFVNRVRATTTRDSSVSPALSDSEKGLYRQDGHTVVVNTADRDWAVTQPNPYDIVIRLNESTAYSHVLMLDDVIASCTSLRILAVFLPRLSGGKGVAAVDQAPFLVLATDIHESATSVTSTRRALNGPNAVICPKKDRQTAHYHCFEDLSRTRLKFHRPKERLGRFRLRVLLPSGEPVVPSGTEGGVAHQLTGAKLLYAPDGGGDWKIRLPASHRTYPAQAPSFDFDFGIGGWRYANAMAAAPTALPESVLRSLYAADGVVAASKLVQTKETREAELPLDWVSLRTHAAAEPYYILCAESRTRSMH